MKRIYFDNLGKMNYWSILLILSLILIVIGITEPFKITNGKFYGIMSSIGFLIQVVYSSKLFWYKNTVQWNKKGAVVRINSFVGKSLQFDEIKMIELNGKTLYLKKFDGKNISFDLNGFSRTDIDRFLEIIKKNIYLPKY